MTLLMVSRTLQMKLESSLLDVVPAFNKILQGSDFAKGFDSVNHHILCAKLSAFGINIVTANCL